MHPQDHVAPRSRRSAVIATVGASRSSSRRESIILPRNDLRETPTTSGRSSTRSRVEIGEQLEIVLQRFAESDSRIKRNGHGIDAATLGRSHIVVEKNPPPPRPHHRSAERVCIVRGVPCMCMMMSAALFSAASGNISGSPRPPVTSLMIAAPASSAARATAAFEVSIEIRRCDRLRKSLDYRDHARQFLFSRNRLRARPGRFAADVDDVARLLRHRQRPVRPQPRSRKIRRHRKTNPA